MTFPASSLPTRCAPLEQFLLDVLAGAVCRGLLPSVRTQDPATGVGPGDGLEQRGHPLGGGPVLDLDQCLDPAIEVAVHHVRAADPVLLADHRFPAVLLGGLVATIAEVEDPRMLQEPADNRTHRDVLA